MNYETDGIKVKAIVTLEKFEKDELIVIREASSHKGQKDGIIFAVPFIKTERTAIGKIVRGESALSGAKILWSVILPSVFPGPGKLIIKDDKESVEERLTNCVRS